MKRTTIFLDDALARRARSAARRQGMSFARLVREAVATYLAQGGTTPPPGPGRLPSIAGQFDSGFSDTSERADQLLWQDPHG